ncbi:MAG: shikimate dehydrogenase [Thermodesulfobacteriota bacterium]
MQDPRLYGIIGHPLGHSLSPPLHNWALQAEALSGAYMRWDIAPEQLDAFVQAARLLPIHGASVTIPHKTAVIEYLDRVQERAYQAGAVNTLYWKDGELCGTNTDIDGFLAPLLSLPRFPQSAIILGNGGAARACVAGLLEHGAQVWICGRNQDKSEALAAEFGAQTLQWEQRPTASADLLVNATPLGMAGEQASLSPMPEGADLERFKTVYELIYNPQDTVLLRQARERGIPTISGLEMFVHQAAAQFRLWTGADMDPVAARRCCAAAL